LTIKAFAKAKVTIVYSHCFLFYDITTKIIFNVSFFNNGIIKNSTTLDVFFYVETLYILLYFYEMREVVLTTTLVGYNILYAATNNDATNAYRGEGINVVGI
jgi:hypothetical protein